MKRVFNKKITGLLFSAMLFTACSNSIQSPEEKKIDDLLSQMTIDEKIGQLQQLTGTGYSGDMIEQVKSGRVGSILNEVDRETINKLQQIAIEESRLGIPLLFARDVIHGFKTIFPVPLGQAASWNPQVVKDGARIAAIEATATGIRWTFAPMLDISRDARWGRIVESLGEDPYLASLLGSAMVNGFQGESLSDPASMVACAKHFVGYGAAEGGRDYNTAILSGEQLWNVYLPPFLAAKEAGAGTFMVSFNEVNGVPSSGNPYLTKEVLRKEWGFDGVVVSDWASLQEMITHGYCSNPSEAAERGIKAGVDMDMMGYVYAPHLKQLTEEGKIDESEIDQAVRNILRLKFRLGLFENPYTDMSSPPPFYAETHLEKAKEAAVQSCVLLKNEGNILPLNNIKSVAVIGPLADAPHDQLGTWIFDGEKEHTVTPLAALKEEWGDRIKINYVKALDYSRDLNKSAFPHALNAARNSDAVLFFAGEESILSGEAKCRADISLPGVQKELLRELSKAGKPIVLIIMAGRPIEIHEELPFVDAFLFAWHPGTMGGPAIADLLFGKATPSGKLPITYPKMVGQIPLYYNHKNTGRPPLEPLGMIDNIPVGAAQTSLGHTSYYLDAGQKPLFPFGFGLTYTTFEYGDIRLSADVIQSGEQLTAACTVKNTGIRDAVEIVQLYIRDMTGSITRPVKELKGFQRIILKAGESKDVSFNVTPDLLSFYTNEGKKTLEPGAFSLWIGTNSEKGSNAQFTLK